MGRMLDGGMPAAPRLVFGVVDVRDVADLHLRAMSNPAAKGERFLAAAGEFMPLLEIATRAARALGHCRAAGTDSITAELGVAPRGVVQSDRA